jgi:uncharacterized membrane protein
MKISIYKTITYRIVASLITGLVAYSLGLNFNWAATLSLVELLIKPIVYFIHEEVWKKTLKNEKYFNKRTV